MQILFLHNNFPAQFGQLSQFLLKEGFDVWYGTERKNSSLPGLKVFNYAPHREPNQQTHPYSGSFEKAALAGQAVARAALAQEKNGLSPDIVVAHSGWGPGMYAKDIWPKAKYIGYFEWYYRADAPDIVHLGNKNRTLDDQLRSQGRNAAILMDLAACDAGICPTQFQFNQFPDCFGSKLHVLHDGVDTKTYCRNPDARLSIEGLPLTGEEEIITYVARGMEPYRGFPEFMKSLEIIQKQRPNVHAIIVGEDRVAYGAKLPEGDSHKKRALEELDLDLSRIHFTGLLPRNKYLEVLQTSTVHVYLTIPFVLSWSMMESMSAECAIVASDNEPVREMIEHGKEGMLVDMKEPASVADTIIALLNDEETRQRIGRAARDRIVYNYDVEDLYLKRKKMIEGLFRS